MPPADPRERAFGIAALVLALIGFLVLAIGDIVATSPTVDEPTHLAAGYSYWKTGDYRLNPEHPPLLKKLAALPLLTMNVWPPSFERGTADTTVTFSKMHDAWESAHDLVTWEYPLARLLFFGRRDAFANAPTTQALPKNAFVNDADPMITRARMMMLVTGLLVIVIVFLWSAEIWGAAGAGLSALLIAFDPNFIANAGLVTTDVGVAALMCGAVWFFWRCCRRFTIANAIGFGVFFGLAQIAKFSALLLVPTIAILVLHRFFSRGEWNVDTDSPAAKARALGAVLAIGAVITVVLIWAAYGFRREASPGHPFRMTAVVDDWYTTASLMSQYPEGPPDDLVLKSRSTVHVGFLGRTIEKANDLHLLPEAYLFGFAQLNRDSMARYGFLRGEASQTGFKSYFFWTFLYKTPIPAILAIVFGLFVGTRRAGRAWSYLVWPVVVYMAVAVVSTINIGHRHILPVYPFLYVLCGAVVTAWRGFSPRARTISAIAAVVAIVGSSLVVVLPTPAPMWGRHLSYMNAIAGGPRNGYEKLVDSNFDWGQDLKRLKSWKDSHMHGQPLRLVYFGVADPRAYGVNYVNLAMGDEWELMVPPETVPAPGYFAISASRLGGVIGEPGMRFFWRDYLARFHARRIGSAGYSIVLYEFPKQ